MSHDAYNSQMDIKVNFSDACGCVVSVVNYMPNYIFNHGLLSHTAPKKNYSCLLTPNSCDYVLTVFKNRCQIAFRGNAHAFTWMRWTYLVPRVSLTPRKAEKRGHGNEAVDWLFERISSYVQPDFCAIFYLCIMFTINCILKTYGIDKYFHLLFHYDVILPYLVKRTRKIWDGNTL